MYPLSPLYEQFTVMKQGFKRIESRRSKQISRSSLCKKSTRRESNSKTERRRLHHNKNVTAPQHEGPVVSFECFSQLPPTWADRNRIPRSQTETGRSSPIRRPRATQNPDDRAREITQRRACEVYNNFPGFHRKSNSSRSPRAWEGWEERPEFGN